MNFRCVDDVVIERKTSTLWGRFFRSSSWPALIRLINGEKLYEVN